MRDGGPFVALILSAGLAAALKMASPEAEVAVEVAVAPAPETEEISPPGEVPAALRAAVKKACVAVALPSGGHLRIWPARDVRAAKPAKAGESPLLRQAVRSSIEPGSLVAIASLESSWLDYRDQRIPPGIYALVYAIQPAFKQHRGVSEFRDVLLLVNPTDTGGGRDLEALVAASRRVSGTSHPAVAAVFPVDGTAELPRLSERADGGLTFEVQAGKFRVGVAVSGKGHLQTAEP